MQPRKFLNFLVKKLTKNSKNRFLFLDKFSKFFQKNYFLQFIFLIILFFFFLTSCSPKKQQEEQKQEKRHWYFTIYHAFTVNFDSNDGSQVAEQLIKEGASPTLPKNPTKKDYSFQGWYQDKNLKEIFNFDSKITKDITVYAKWQQEVFLVNFEEDGGTEVAEQRVDRGNKATRPNPTKEGWTFQNWYQEQDYQNLFDFNTSITKTTTVYAKWKANYGTRISNIVITTIPETGGGVAYHNNKFYFVDPGDDDDIKIYNKSLQKESDISLHADNGSSRGIEIYNNHIYTTDLTDNKVYVYSLDGVRDTTKEFNLHADNGSATGIVFHDGYFYVCDYTDQKVYVYSSSGVRDATKEFSVSELGQGPLDITFYRGKFYVSALVTARDRLSTYQNKNFVGHIVDKDGRGNSFRQALTEIDGLLYSFNLDDAQTKRLEVYNLVE